MIIKEEKDSGLLIQDNEQSLKGLDIKELQKLIDYYTDLIDTLKEKSNNIPEGKFSGSENPKDGIGFFYDGTIKYGTYCYNNEKKIHTVNEEEIKKITARLKQIEAALRKKQFIKDSLERLNPFSNSRKK